MRIFLVLMIALWPTLATAAGLFVSDTVTKKTYTVSGKTISEIKAEMKRKGPKGYWAFAKTDWKWDGRCKMRYKAVITFPKLRNRNALSVSDLARWDKMTAALWDHEMQHVVIGRNWAAAIKKANCDKAAVNRINKRHKGNDAAFDRRTDHGRREGVHF